MKVVLVTGANGLLGAHTVQCLRSSGHRVIEVQSPRAESSAGDNPPSVSLRVDLTERNGIDNLLKALSKMDTRVDGFVHLARNRRNLTGPDASRDAWLAEYELSTYVPYRIGTQLFKSFGLSRMVVSSSIFGLVAQQPKMYPDIGFLNPHYGAAKAAVLQLVRDLAVQFAPTCTVNAISPGGIQSTRSNEVVHAYTERVPSKKMTSLESVAAGIEFLLASNTDSVTGQNLVVDGGWTAW